MCEESEQEVVQNRGLNHPLSHDQAEELYQGHSQGGPADVSWRWCDWLVFFQSP